MGHGHQLKKMSRIIKLKHPFMQYCTKLNEATGTGISVETLNKRWYVPTVAFLKNLFL